MRRSGYWAMLLASAAMAGCGAERVDEFQGSIVGVNPRGEIIEVPRDRVCWSTLTRVPDDAIVEATPEGDGFILYDAAVAGGKKELRCICTSGSKSKCVPVWQKTDGMMCTMMDGCDKCEKSVADVASACETTMTASLVDGAFMLEGPFERCSGPPESPDEPPLAKPSAGGEAARRALLDKLVLSSEPDVACGEAPSTAELDQAVQELGYDLYGPAGFPPLPVDGVAPAGFAFVAVRVLGKVVTILVDRAFFDDQELAAYSALMALKPKSCTCDGGGAGEKCVLSSTFGYYGCKRDGCPDTKSCYMVFEDTSVLAEPDAVLSDEPLPPPGFTF